MCICTSCNAPICQNLASLGRITTATTIRTSATQARALPLAEVQLPFRDKTEMEDTFGASLLHSEGGDRDDVWCKRWAKAVCFKCHHYDLPGGATEREFVGLFSEEVLKLAIGEVRSEQLIVFLVVLLPRDALVKGAHVRHLLKRRMQAWRSNQIDELLFDAERCSQQMPKPQRGNGDEEHTVRVFTRLMLRGQLRSAVRWMMERASSGGILDPSTVGHEGGKTVLEVLKEKHPEPREASVRAFLSCDELPPLVDIDVTAAHVQKVAGFREGQVQVALWLCIGRISY